MTLLQQRMLDALVLRGRALRTQPAYIEVVALASALSACRSVKTRWQYGAYRSSARRVARQASRWRVWHRSRGASLPQGQHAACVANRARPGELSANP